MYNPIYESVNVLASDREASTYGLEARKIIAVLEDVNSPITAKYKETLYKEVLDKAHINFGDIPKSQGDITKYSGYPTMTATIKAIRQLAEDAHSKEVVRYCDTISKAVSTIADLSATYGMGFSTKTEYVALEYNVYVYTCVEATTALLNNFIEYTRSVDAVSLPEIKNTKLRADKFYFDQLEKFNKIQDQMGIEYRNMLENMCQKGKNQLIGTSTLIGVATVSAVALAIVPVTRELIYQIYNIRVNLSEALDMQAKFLEMNSDALQYKETIDPVKRKKIAGKQKNIAKTLRAWADKFRVSSAKSITSSKKEIEKDNKRLSLDSLRSDVDNSDLSDSMMFV